MATFIYNPPNGGTAITGHQYCQKENATDTCAEADWTDISDSAPGEANATGYTVTSLTNGTAYTFRVRAVNAVGGGSESDAVTRTPSSTTSPATSPTVSTIALTSDPNDDAHSVDDATYAIGDTVAATVTFDAAVTVSGAPQLTLDVGGTDKTAAYRIAGSTATQLVFAWTVAEDDADTDGIGIAASSLGLNGGTIQAETTDATAATLTHPAVAMDSAHKVDGVRPVLSEAEISDDNGAVILRFDEELHESNAPDIGRFSVDVEGTDRGLTGSPVVSGRTVTLTLLGAAADEADMTVSYVDPSAGDDSNAIQDEAGNEAESFTDQEVNTSATLGGPGTPPASFFKRSLDAAANLEAERTFGDGCTGGNSATPIRLTWDVPKLPRSRGGRLIYDYRMKEAEQDSWSDWIQIGSKTREQIETYQQDGKLDYDVFHFGDLSPERTSRFQVRVSEVWQKDGSAWSNGAGPWSEASDTAVAGPCVESASPRVSVANPVTEEDYLKMLFRVELSRASDETVTVDYATEEGSATAGVDYEETSGTLEFAPGETKKTITVAIIDDDVEDSGETFKVRLSNAVNAEIWDEVGTGTIYNDEAGVEVDSLTASFENVPESHDGASAFTFELTFSENFPISYKTLEDAAFEVDGGAVTAARRLERPSNRRWEIEVEPAGNGDVTLVLPDRACTENGAVCPADGRRLAAPVEATVAGPDSAAVAPDPQNT